MSESEKINYIELPATNIELVKAFYQNTFDWQFVDYGNDYTAFNDGFINGGFYKSEQACTTANGSVLIVLYAKNLENSVAKVVNNNGRIIKPIFEFPGGRRFHFTDPCGNELAIWSDS